MAVRHPQTHVVRVPALTAGGRYETKQQGRIDDVRGEPALNLSIVPPVIVARAMAALRKAPTLPFEQRILGIEAAVDLFASGTVDGMAPETYRRIVSEISGSPISVVRNSTSAIVATGRSLRRIIEAAAPAGVATDISDPAFVGGSALWVPRGRTLAVHAAGNSPAIHAAWLPALALGLRIAVRPSRREPLTPYRLISALRQSGFSDDQVMLLATDYSGADEMLRAADLGLVYGGEDIVAKYGSDPRLSVQGPGRSKILITDDVDWRDHLEVIVSSVSAGGGANCMNASAILVEKDASALSEALAQRLASIPTLPPLDEAAALPVRRATVARGVEHHVLARARGSRVWLGEHGIASDLGDGSAALRPAVFELGSADDERLQLEFPFPCVWVVPWSRRDGVPPLRHSLALTVMTQDTELIETLLAEPSIAHVNVGAIHTGWSEPHLPHDDYLVSGFMRAKAVRKSPFTVEHV